MAGNYIRIMKNWEWYNYLMAVKYFNQVHREKNMLKVCYIYYIPSKLFDVCVCVRVEHFYKIYKEYSFKKRLLSFQTWWNEKNFANLWFFLLLLFQLASLSLAYANINPILIHSVCTSDMENIPCYTIITITQLFSQWLLRDLP